MIREICIWMFLFFFQTSPLRACKLKESGIDRTLTGQIAVVLLNGVHPLISGCVSVFNQVYTEDWTPFGEREIATFALSPSVSLISFVWLGAVGPIVSKVAVFYSPVGVFVLQVNFQLFHNLSVSVRLWHNNLMGMESFSAASFLDKLNSQPTHAQPKAKK